MKKIIILTMALLMAVAANAKIQNSFWGVTLGQSTKADVEQMLKQKGYDVSGNDILLWIEHLENISFEGIDWERLFFEFYNDTLSDIYFSQRFDTEIDAQIAFLTLKQKIDAKYGELVVKYKTWGCAYEDYESFIYFCVKESDDGHWDLSLLYSDRDMWGLGSNDSAK